MFELNIYSKNTLLRENYRIQSYINFRWIFFNFFIHTKDRYNGTYRSDSFPFFSIFYTGSTIGSQAKKIRRKKYAKAKLTRKKF